MCLTIASLAPCAMLAFRADGKQQAAGSSHSVAACVASGVPSGADAEAVAALATAVGARGAEPLSDPLMLLRFYEHRGRNVDKSVAMYAQTVAWRAAYQLHRVMQAYGHGESYDGDGSRTGDVKSWSWTWQPASPEAKSISRHVFFGKLSDPAPDGGPVLLWRVGVADYGGMVRENLVEEMIAAFVAHFEDAMQSGRAASLRAGRLIKARVVADAFGFSIENLRHLAVLQRIIALVENHFPEVSATVTVIRAPLSVRTLYGLVRPWLTTHVQQKVQIFGDDFQEGMLQHSGLELRRLPTYLGGQALDDEAGLAQAVPQR